MAPMMPSAASTRLPYTGLARSSAADSAARRSYCQQAYAAAWSPHDHVGTS